MKSPRLCTLRSIFVVVSVVCLRCALADDHAGMEWHSDGKVEFAPIIWRTKLDLVGSMTVGADTIVIGGGNSGFANGRCVALSKETGKIIWSVSHARLPKRVNDMAANITSTPAIDRDRVYYVSNRGELCCRGLADGHELWTLDMPKTLGIFKRDPGDVASQAPSPIVAGDVVYCITGNGTDYDQKAPAPDAPSFIAVNKLTGNILWSSNAPGNRIAYGQWSTPALVNIDHTSQMLFPCGDGALYSFEPASGKQLWKIDCRKPGAANDSSGDEFITAPPLVVGDFAYVSPAADCERSHPGRRVLAIDLRKHAIRWTAEPEGFSGTMGPLCFAHNTVYAAGILGTVAAIDADTGKTRWTRNFGDKDPTITFTGGIHLSNDRLYLISEDGKLLILFPGSGATIAECDLGTGVGAPVVENDHIFVTTRNEVLAMKLPKK